MLLLLGGFLIFQTPASAQVKEVRRVLILNVLGPLSSPGVARMDEAIVAGLEKSPYQIELYTEDLEATLFPDEASQRQFREWYIRKYHRRQPDVIIAIGFEPLRFLVTSHESAFPGVPIVFCELTKEILDELKLDSHFTGVWAAEQPEETLKAALALQPGTKHVVVVGGAGVYDRHLEAVARNSFRKYESSLDFTYLTDLGMPTLIERLKQLPDHTIVYYTSIMQDAEGTRFIDANQSLPIVLGAANAPVFVVDDADLGKGTAGGYLLSWENVGQTAAQMAVRVLNGEKPQDIPIVRSPDAYMFDWRALKRWGLRESNLPPGSIVFNRQPTAWESYKWYILGGIALILLEALLILGLLLQRARARKAETELEVTYDRLRRAVEAGKFVGWEWDIKSGRNRWFGDLQTMFGILSDTYSASLGEFRQRVHPEDRELVLESIVDARQSRKSYVAEFRVLHLDGSVRWVVARGQFYYAANGDAFRMLGMAVDITDRKQAEYKLRESEERFRLVANKAPVLIWMSGPDKLCTYFNQPWLEFTGRPVEAELGNGWAEGVHPEDLKECLDTYTHAFDRRESFKMQYRLRRHDREYRWVSDIGVPRLNPDGSFEGYIGSCIDITDSKLAQEALADVGRKLIEAHEEERTWIARELHDDVSQRIALLAIELEQWNQQLPASAVKIHNHIHHARERLLEVSKDIQALSHRLHSSKLEYLGIVAAANSFCKELSEQQKVEIDFSHTGIPHSLPKEISLCLFRVLQEALQNAVKHSAERHFKVELQGTSGEIQLTVNDLGVGFDQQDAINQRGLGLISMQERLRLVGGELSINSQPKRGTTIHARVPLRPTDSMRAAG
jgi:PAS domain S-box-containing protein